MSYFVSPQVGWTQLFPVKSFYIPKREGVQQLQCAIDITWLGNQIKDFYVSTSAYPNPDDTLLNSNLVQIDSVNTSNILSGTTGYLMSNVRCRREAGEYLTIWCIHSISSYDALINTGTYTNTTQTGNCVILDESTVGMPAWLSATGSTMQNLIDASHYISFSPLGGSAEEAIGTYSIIGADDSTYPWQLKLGGDLSRHPVQPNTVVTFEVRRSIPFYLNSFTIYEGLVL